MNREWLNKCFIFAYRLYVAFPYEVIEEMYAQGEPEKLDKEEVVDFVKKYTGGTLEYVDGTLPEFEKLGYSQTGYFLPSIVSDENFQLIKSRVDSGDEALRVHLGEVEVKYVLTEQNDAPFYIPTLFEVEELCATDMLMNEHYEALGKLFGKNEEKEAILGDIWHAIMLGAEVTNIVEGVAAIMAEETHNGSPVMDMDQLTVLKNVKALTAQVRDGVLGMTDVELPEVDLPKIGGGGWKLPQPALAGAGGGTTTNNNKTMNLGGVHITVNGYNVQDDNALASMVATKINEMLDEDNSVYK